MGKICEIWCDGSYRQAHRICGAGWVIDYGDGRTEQKPKTLPKLKDSFNYGSQIAELGAALNAMSTLPPGTPAIIHMDCKIAMESLMAGRLLLNKPQNPPSLQRMFDRALAAYHRLGDVEFRLTSDRADTNMRLAHRLSREASAPAAV